MRVAPVKNCACVVGTPVTTVSGVPVPVTTGCEGPTATFVTTVCGGATVPLTTGTVSSVSTGRARRK